MNQNRRIGFSLCAGALLVLMPGMVSAQLNATKGWQAVVSVNRFAQTGVDKDWRMGPALGLRRMLGNHFAVDIEATWVTSHSALDVYSGVLGSLGPAWAWRGERHTFSVGTGFIAGTFVTESFYDGSDARSSTFGLYTELKGAYWLGPTVGVAARAGWILWWGDPGSNLSVGLALRW
jgi:hypothetical protein